MDHPNIIYVVVVDDGEGNVIPVSSENLKDFDDGEIVGIYELKETKELSINYKLV